MKTETNKGISVTKKEFYQPIQKSWVEQSGLEKAVFEKEVSFAIQHIHSNPKLADCDGNSVLKAVLNVAQTGLTLNPISKYAYLVPRWNYKINSFECVLEPCYIGLSKLLTDCGSVVSMNAQVIWEGDLVEVDMASPEKVIKHVPYFLNGKEKGSIRGVYSIAKLHDGSTHCEIMSAADVYDIRERSESYKAYKKEKIKTCIWVDDEAEMFRKTVVKRHYKYLPKTDQSAKLQKAIQLDNEVNGFDGPISWEFVNSLESMINSSAFDDDKKELLMTKIYDLEKTSEGQKMAEYLMDNQKIMGLHESPKSQGDAMEATKNAVARDRK